ncbi:MAG: hypothetical protein JWP97_6183 [Labilithrix sp.]|nr:hypothetical protein [Labilithrix sp.]
MLLKKILVAIGIAKAPAPVKSYLTVSSFFGAVPAVAWVAWKNRDAIRSAVGRLRARAPQQLSARAA